MLRGRLFSIRYREELAAAFKKTPASASVMPESFVNWRPLPLWLSPCGILFGFQEKAFRFRHTKFPSGRSSPMARFALLIGSLPLRGFLIIGGRGFSCLFLEKSCKMLLTCDLNHSSSEKAVYSAIN